MPDRDVSYSQEDTPMPDRGASGEEKESVMVGTETYDPSYNSSSGQLLEGPMRASPDSYDGHQQSSENSSGGSRGVEDTGVAQRTDAQRQK